MASIDDFIASILGAQDNNALVDANEAERTGGTGDALFNIDQAAISVRGGTSLSAPQNTISPNVVLDDLAAGKWNNAYLLYIAIGTLLVLWFRKKH